MTRSCIAMLVFVAACGAEDQYFDASIAHDAGVADEGASGEGGVPVHAAFTIVGCDQLSFDADAHARCTAPRGRPLTFVSLGIGVDTLLWKFVGGAPPSSMLLSPEVTWSDAGSYTVTLAAGGSGGGSATGTGVVQIVLGSAGSTCNDDGDCDATSGFTCLCPNGSACPAALAAGLCVRRCETTACAAGEACVDLTRGGTGSADGGVGDGGVGDSFRARLCLPTCSSASTCRTGFACRELPEVAAGSSSGGDYTWVTACFAPVLDDVGAACETSDHTPDDSSCLTGHCEPLGARGICTEICDASSPCPESAVCVTLPSVGPRCLLRCAAGASCNDPLMSCQGPGLGGLGYSLPSTEPNTTTLCAPRRCATAADCAPAGACDSVGGALFCQQ